MFLNLCFGHTEAECLESCKQKDACRFASISSTGYCHMTRTCNEKGSETIATCDKKDGQCKCMNGNVSGRKCDKCAPGKWNWGSGKKLKYFLLYFFRDIL